LGWLHPDLWWAAKLLTNTKRGGSRRISPSCRS